jgi:hypothetical protein
VGEDVGYGTQQKAPDLGQAAQGASSNVKTKPAEGKLEAEKASYSTEHVAYRVRDNLGLVIAHKVETTLKNESICKWCQGKSLNVGKEGILYG